MLEFTKGMGIKRISYAASFGKDDLSEYGDKLIKKSAALAKKFDAISVREDSGVDICNEYWGVKAQQHVDPTLLLEKNDYLKLIHEDINILKKSDGQISTYVLDSDKNKDEIIDKVCSHLKLKSFDIMPPKPMTKKELRSNPNKYALPHVTQWLKSFKDADFVITDSFHGTVFSIIFNKPFIAIGNKERGLTRFSSLLRLFKLEDRLVSNSNGALSIVNSPINWREVNDVKFREKKRGIKYLIDNLPDVPRERYYR
jgi:polysaccharide pyruvyl transferase WcaK-like protein